MAQETDNKTDNEVVEGLEEYAPDRAMMIPYWDQIAAIMGGVKTVRAAGKKYLPKFENESPADYKDRVNYARFTNIFRDIVEGLAAKPFEKEIRYESDQTTEYFDNFREDVDGRGNNLTQFASETFFNGIANADEYILIDYPVTNPNEVKTKADKKRLGTKPYWSHILGRNVREIKHAVINGKEVLTYVKIYEAGSPNHIRIFERTVQGGVEWKLYQQIENPTNPKKTLWKLINGGDLAISQIPLVGFATGRRNGSDFSYDPAMQDAADLQLELYKDETALNYAKNLTAYPMLAGNGVTPEKDANGDPKSLSLGPKRVLYAPSDGAGNAGSWTYIEIAATSLKFLKDDIKETITNLRELGRQPLTAQSGNLTVITTAVAAGKSRSAVAAWALALKDTIENALVITAEWESVKDDAPDVVVWTEFDNFIDYGEDLTHLRDMRKNGDISSRRLAIETKRRGILGDDYDFDDDQKEILNEQPSDEFDDFGDSRQINQDVPNGDDPENQLLQNTDVE